MQWAGHGIEKGMVHVVSRRPLLFCKVLFPLFAAWGGVGATLKTERCGTDVFKV